MKPEKMKDAQREKFTLVGEEKTVEEIITEVLKDKEFYEESGGGLTYQEVKYLLSLNLLKPS
ncbi:putative pyruvate formate-lyase-activating enzyme [Streptococcus pneumoniae GA60080]|nr:putative pyruvate formate-lyase-activating enzyme [Streptococcus pneumoniae GA60080]